ncbi:MAG: AAA family ATPase [Pirellulaceae bacterium]
MSEMNPDDVAAVKRCQEEYSRLRQELSKVIVGQDDVIEQVLVAMFARGHALLEGVPGLAKTLLISSLGQALHLSFKRIQFTPDLMPSDVTGAEVIQEDLETRQRAYRFLPGPIFANLLLADETNRTPPKTQAAMLGNDARTPSEPAARCTNCRLRSLYWPRKTRWSKKERIRSRSPA